MNTPIDDFVRIYARSGMIRAHMPGHKGRGDGPERWDITEMTGADSLYEASGIIRESEENASRLFGSGITAYSTEGSSLSIRAMLLLALRRAPRTDARPWLLAGRNAHRTLLSAAALLDFGREELEHYLLEKNLRWSTDSTNSNAYFRRNLIRNEALPQIQTIWKSFDSSLLNLSEQVGKEISELNLREFMADRIALKSFEGKTVLQRMAAIFCMWDFVFGEKELPMSLLDRILRAIEKAEDCTEGSNGALFTLYHGVLFLTDPALDGLCAGFECAFDPSVNQRIGLPCGLCLTLSANDDSLDDEKSLRLNPGFFGSDVRIRFARLGDRIQLKDGSKLVKRLLQDMGIPAFLRCRVPVIEDSDGICAVFGRVWGGKDRICVKFRTSLAPKAFPLYIVTKG